MLLWDLCSHLQAPRSLLGSLLCLIHIPAGAAASPWAVWEESRHPVSAKKSAEGHEIEDVLLVFLVQQGFERLLVSSAWFCSSHFHPRSPGIQCCTTNAEQGDLKNWDFLVWVEPSGLQVGPL